MNFQVFSIIAAIICININTECDAQRTKDKMYEEISGLSACFRRMNGTHQTGCSSEREGSTGVVHYVTKPSDLEVLLNVSNGLNYIPVMPIGMFEAGTVHRLESHDSISGLVVYKKNDTERPRHYTHEDECPNRLSNLPSTCNKTWNVGGSGMLLEDIRFPIFYLDDDEEIEKISRCFSSFNDHPFESHPHRSVCSLELDSFMFASKDSPTCIRRSNSIFNLNPIRFCDPMGDSNVWSSLFPIGRSTEEPVELVNKTMRHIIVATRLDTTSMFHEVVPGAINPITGIVTLLATARLLKRMLPEYNDAYKQNVLFVMFHGESYDYIGSQRFVYDMENGLFPDNQTDSEEVIRSIKLEDVTLFVEISQLSNVTDNIYVHTYNDVPQRDFVTKLKKNGNKLNVSDEPTGNLPPASLQTFLKAKRNLPGLVLSDHKDEYANRYYNSIFDNASNIINFKYTHSNTKDEFVLPPGSIQEHIARVTDMLALSLYEEITGREYKDKLADDNGYLIDELFHCHLENANCKIHQAIQRAEYKEHPFSLYVGVADAKNRLTILMGLTLFWFTSRPIGDKDCNKSLTTGSTQVYRHYVMSEDIDQLNETKCYRASMNFTEARSPAFLIEDYDWESGKYSTWTESVWKSFNVRLFLRPARSHEIMTIAVGAVTFAASVALIYFLNSKSRLLFEAETITPTNC